MNIVFLTNFYQPNPLANGVCVHAVAKKLCEMGNNVFVICLRKGKENKEEIIDGVNIIRISMPFYQKVLFFADSKKKKWYYHIIQKFGIFLSRVKKMIHIKDYPLRDMGTVKQYVQVVKSLIKRFVIEKIVCVYTPIEAIKAGTILKRKNKDIKYYYYSLDTLSNENGKGVFSSNRRYNIGYKLEKYYFNIYDVIILMSCHKNHYSANYNEVQNKFAFSDFPLFEKQTDKNKDETSDSIVFTGSLYKTIRNPAKSLELLSCELDQFVLHFYGYSDCAKVFNEYLERFPGRIIDHGLVPHKTALKAISNAKILLSIGNSNTDMVPSKIYEYVSTGKPIIHVYSDKNDSCLRILEKYGNAFCICELTEKNRIELHEFIVSAKSIDVSKIEEKFVESTPAYTANIILN